MRPDRERDLDRELRDLGPRVEYPPVPDLAGSVRGRLAVEAGRTAQPARSRSQLWWIAAAALVLLVAVPVFSFAIRGTFDGGMAAGGGAAESGGQEADDGSDAVNEPRTVTLMEEQEDGPSGGASSNAGALAAEGGSGASSSAASGSSAAACMSPEAILETQPSRGAPGDEFSIRGRNFDANSRDCDDDPARNVRVEFLQDGRTWELGSVEAGKGSRIAAKLEVPADARPGRATVRATYGQGPPESRDEQTPVEARFFVLE